MKIWQIFCRGYDELKDKVVLRGCPKQGDNDVSGTTDDDWAEEYLDNILAIKVVSDVQEAVDHIQNTEPGILKLLLRKTLLMQIILKKSRCCCGICKCINQVYRRRGIRFWRRNGYQYPKNSCQGPNGNK